jgi:hypothetical protein
MLYPVSVKQRSCIRCWQALVRDDALASKVYLSSVFELVGYFLGEETKHPQSFSGSLEVIVSHFMPETMPSLDSR